jgi:thiol-disulfide isomerase/thioredoxin
MVGDAAARKVTVVLAALALVACRRAEPEPIANERDAVAASAHASKVTILKPGGGDAASVIREELARTKASGRDLVVYVGATWCEPCQRFHHAAERGELDADFPTLTLLEFDLDVDGERLARAGYTSELVPLFVVPENDGRASARRFEGSIKGDRAVANIAPRLRALITSK